MQPFAPPPRPLVGELVDHLASPWSGLGVTCHKIVQERRVGPLHSAVARSSAKRCGHGFSPSPFPGGGRGARHLAPPAADALPAPQESAPRLGRSAPALLSPGHGVETPGSVVTVSTVFPTFSQSFPRLVSLLGRPFRHLTFSTRLSFASQRPQNAFCRVLGAWPPSGAGSPSSKRHRALQRPAFLRPDRPPFLSWNFPQAPRRACAVSLENFSRSGACRAALFLSKKFHMLDLRAWPGSFKKIFPRNLHAGSPGIAPRRPVLSFHLSSAVSLLHVFRTGCFSRLTSPCQRPFAELHRSFTFWTARRNIRKTYNCSSPNHTGKTQVSFDKSHTIPFAEKHGKHMCGKNISVKWGIR